jgi:hypothetical protein
MFRFLGCRDIGPVIRTPTYGFGYAELREAMDHRNMIDLVHGRLAEVLAVVGHRRAVNQLTRARIAEVLTYMDTSVPHFAHRLPTTSSCGQSSAMDMTGELQRGLDRIRVLAECLCGTGAIRERRRESSQSTTAKAQQGNLCRSHTLLCRILLLAQSRPQPFRRLGT